MNDCILCSGCVWWRLSCTRPCGRLRRMRNPLGKSATPPPPPQPNLFANLLKRRHAGEDMVSGPRFSRSPMKAAMLPRCGNEPMERNTNGKGER